jgi:hypothetical protein
MNVQSSLPKASFLSNRDLGSHVTRSVIYGKRASLGLLAAIALVVSGCGGKSGGGISSLYIGHYLGSWTNSTNSHVGTADVTVDAGGHVTGTLHDTTSSTDDTVAGDYDNSGNFTGTITVPGPTTDPLTGVLAPSTIAAQTHLIGTLEQIESNVIVGSFNLDVTKQ